MRSMKGCYEICAYCLQVKNVRAPNGTAAEPSSQRQP
jgi:hypothetical protein